MRSVACEVGGTGFGRRLPGRRGSGGAVDPAHHARNERRRRGGGVGSIAPLADGVAVVAWQQAATPGVGVHRATLTPAGLGPSTSLDPLGRSPQVATDVADAAVASWIGTDGVYAVLRGADGEVTAPRRILDVAPDREGRGRPSRVRSRRSLTDPRPRAGHASPRGGSRGGESPPRPDELYLLASCPRTAPPGNGWVWTLT